jgi:hypothetical protein
MYRRQTLEAETPLFNIVEVIKHDFAERSGCLIQVVDGHITQGCAPLIVSASDTGKTPHHTNSSLSINDYAIHNTLTNPHVRY